MNEGALAARLEVLNAIVAALGDVATLVDVIEASSSRPDAVRRLRERFGISEIGAMAVLDTSFSRLIPLYRERLVEERDARARELRLEQGD